ncbi:hypothetical protein L1267_23440 [Pseudoalteromonas sp. OFAV1]|jgi:hypothetical protein|uniref:hypothetical protein n=1 Tax=Pseudoalteromonas sp. OFAV1 TaxID=2908892 RepID=UPI001F2463B3|nr:hypothetical protein [Pseudoalteromonas sp. OFAV1]MCF2903326.1 hypothetical protein [Pseudoalteromonas sp. OFAV1]
MENLQTLINKENAILKVFNKPLMDINQLSLKQISSLKASIQSGLSPENLHLDGLATKEHVASKKAFFDSCSKELNKAHQLYYVKQASEGESVNVDFESHCGQDLEKMLLNEGFTHRKTYSECKKASHEAHLIKHFDGKTLKVDILQSTFMGRFTQFHAFLARN